MERLGVFGSFGRSRLVLHARNDVSSHVMDDAVAIGFCSNEEDGVVSWSWNVGIGQGKLVCNFVDFQRHFLSSSDWRPLDSVQD